MTELTDRLIPIDEASSEARLAVSLVLKLLAALHEVGTLDDDAFCKVASAIIVELGSDQERFRAWGFLEALVPDFKRPEDERKGGTDESGKDDARDDDGRSADDTAD